MTVNVLFGIAKPVVEVLKGNFNKDEDGSYTGNELTDEERKRFKDYYTDRWTDEVAGAVTWQCVSSYLSDHTSTRGVRGLELLDVTDAVNKFVGNIFIIGAWNMDGTQYGTRYELVENGTTNINGLEVPHFDKVITGTPVYPINAARAKKYMPSGKLEQVNLMSGHQADRIWT